MSVDEEIGKRWNLVIEEIEGKEERETIDRKRKLRKECTKSKTLVER